MTKLFLPFLIGIQKKDKIMFRVYLLYVERKKKDSIADVRLFIKRIHICMDTLTHIYIYRALLVCHRKPICRRALYDLKIF